MLLSLCTGQFGLVLHISVQVPLVVYGLLRDKVGIGIRADNILWRFHRALVVVQGSSLGGEAAIGWHFRQAFVGNA